MRIAIASDSRGAEGRPPWTFLLMDDNPQHEYFASLPISTSFTTIFDHTPRLLSAGKFDLGIIQLGYHEYVVPWVMSYWDVTVKDYDPDYREHLSLCPDFILGGQFKLFKKTYHYRHDETVKKVFDLIRTCCNKLIFVQMPYSWEEFKDKTIMMNSVYAPLCDATVALPMDQDFPEKHTVYSGIDRVHYNQDYAKHLADLVKSAIRRI